MIIETKNNKQVVFSSLIPDDYDALAAYLEQLSIGTKKRFGPHPFERNAIAALYTTSDKYVGYVARTIDMHEIIAYSIVKIGYLEQDRLRLELYGMLLNTKTDCVFAPSVADAWQSMGIGNSLLAFIKMDLQSKCLKRIILWGGVQADNEKAVNYYIKNGFKILGHFTYNGENYDMVLEIG